MFISADIHHPPRFRKLKRCPRVPNTPHSSPSPLVSWCAPPACVPRPSPPGPIPECLAVVASAGTSTVEVADNGAMDKAQVFPATDHASVRLRPARHPLLPPHTRHHHTHATTVIHPAHGVMATSTEFARATPRRLTRTLRCSTPTTPSTTPRWRAWSAAGPTSTGSAAPARPPGCTPTSFRSTPSRRCTASRSGRRTATSASGWTPSGTWRPRSRCWPRRWARASSTASSTPATTPTTLPSTRAVGHLPGRPASPCRCVLYVMSSPLPVPRPVPAPAPVLFGGMLLSVPTLLLDTQLYRMSGRGGILARARRRFTRLHPPLATATANTRTRVLPRPLPRAGVGDKFMNAIEPFASKVCPRMGRGDATCSCTLAISLAPITCLARARPAHALFTHAHACPSSSCCLALPPIRLEGPLHGRGRQSRVRRRQPDALLAAVCRLQLCRQEQQRLVGGIFQVGARPKKKHVRLPPSGLCPVASKPRCSGLRVGPTGLRSRCAGVNPLAPAGGALGLTSIPLGLGPRLDTALPCWHISKLLSSKTYQNAARGRPTLSHPSNQWSAPPPAY